MCKLVTHIKRKPELRNLDSMYVAQRLQDRIESYPRAIVKLEHENSYSRVLRCKEVRAMIKDVRAELRHNYGMFKNNKSHKVHRFLNRLAEKLEDIDIFSEESIYFHKQLLRCHKSTKERLDDYSRLYSELFNITGRPRAILDLGCGINPLSFVFMGLKSVEYTAVELAKQDCDLMELYFNMAGDNCRGKVLQMDLSEEIGFPEAEVCFLFKILDVLESQKRGISRTLLNTIESDWIVVSFATRTLSGKEICSERRWFKELLEEYDYDTLELDNEIFYIICNRALP